ncbi:MAG TPA: SCP2 sterol-binding domain-containing protein [Candidatus Deferrimicrobium sp.]|nr:SCP2 sterol-binding domain-containing protein [Candidatus Deferrimicrobium sp.]
MELFKGPTDIFGIAIYSSLIKKMEENPSYREFINKLNLNLVVELDYYPLMIAFKKDSFEITREIEHPDVRIKIKTQDFLDIVDGKTSIIKTFFRGKMGFKPFYKIFTKLFTVYKIFSNMI